MHTITKGSYHRTVCLILGLYPSLLSLSSMYDVWFCVSAGCLFILSVLIDDYLSLIFIHNVINITTLLCAVSLNWQKKHGDIHNFWSCT